MSNNLHLLTRCDHIVYCCLNLNEGIGKLKDQLGILPKIGGRHLNRGTHNALFKIGPSSYFEILSPDPETDIPPPRWMGIDLVDKPTITRWAINTNDIKKDSDILRSYRTEYADVQSGCRLLNDGSSLNWNLTDPLTQPEVEVVPFLLDWQNSVHPSTNMDQECTLLNVQLLHPNPHSISEVITSFGIEIDIRQSTEPFIQVTLESPKGVVTL